MRGHGWVRPNPDGSRARCGGPGVCSECSKEAALVEVPTMRPESPEHLAELVDSIVYKRGWSTWIELEEGCPVAKLMIVSCTPDSYDPDQTIRVRHEFMVPPASYSRDVWAAWVFDRYRDVETHEAGEFFMIDGIREFAPHHGNGEDPYRVWHVSDYAATKVRAGEDR